MKYICKKCNSIYFVRPQDPNVSMCSCGSASFEVMNESEITK